MMQSEVLCVAPIARFWSLGHQLASRSALCSLLCISIMVKGTRCANTVRRISASLRRPHRRMRSSRSVQRADSIFLLRGEGEGSNRRRQREETNDGEMQHSDERMEASRSDSLRFLRSASHRIASHGADCFCLFALLLLPRRCTAICSM